MAPRKAWQAIVAIPADGTASSLERIQADDDEVQGWELAISVEAGADSRPELNLRMSDRWDGNNPLLVVGARCDRGGRIFLPFPRVDFTAADAAAAAAGTARVLARPWCPGESIVGARVLYGLDRASIAAGATSLFAVPVGATHYRVSASGVVTQTLTVLEVGGDGVNAARYVLDPGAAGQPSDWREVPPISDNDTQLDISITNNNGATAAAVAVAWRYELGSLL